MDRLPPKSESERAGSGQGILCLVGTPIGNMEDITARALRILGEADLIAAEDTRHTRQLLTRFGLTKPLISYFEHNQNQREEELLEHLRNGKCIALVSDAGMPGISDPGTRLVEAAIREGIPVIPIPGPSAVITALCASGQPTERFVFEGFLPRTGKIRQERLRALAGEERTIVLYESPHRLVDTLGQLKKALGNERSITIARELTKVYEEFWRGSLEEAEDCFAQRSVKGELTLVIHGAPLEEETIKIEDLLGGVEEAVEDGLPASEAIRRIAKSTGVSRRELYQAYISWEEEKANKNSGN